jgi:hypothetical protein
MPVHFDHNYAFQTAFGRPLVDSTFTLALVTGQSVTDISQNVFANLGWDEVRLPAPVFEGDTIYSSSEVLEKRESRSRPNVGIVTVKTTDYNQDGTPVITFIRPLMVYKRHHCPRDSQADFRRCDVSIMARTATPREWISFLAQLHYEDIPDAAVDHIREHLLDWIGSALAVEQDDLYNASVFHPATVVFPAAFAAAQQTGVSGREVLAALVAGYEAGVRLRSYLGRSHYRVFHTTGTAGTLAAATAVSHLLGSDEETMLHALSSTGLQAAELWEFLRDAADSKQPHTAKAVSAGLLAAYLARDGFTGAECILEGRVGWSRRVGWSPAYPRMRIRTSSSRAGGELGSARDLLQVPRFVPPHPPRRRRTATGDGKSKGSGRTTSPVSGPASTRRP